jgi:hypothetical protein
VLLLVHGLVVLFLLDMKPHAAETGTALHRSTDLRFIPLLRKDALLRDMPQEPPAPSPPLVQQQRPKEFAIREPNDAQPSAGPGSIDWRAEGRSTAIAHTADDAVTYRSFGPREAPTTPDQEGSSFAWDKVHTQKIEDLPEGGIRVRLSDNCDMFIILIPTVACTLGKREARGDLFEEMVQPNAPGDWKDPINDP